MPIMLQKYAILLLIKIMFLGHKNIFSHKTVIEQVSYTNLKNRSKVSLISHACCTKDASSLETVVNLVPEAKLSDRLLVLQPGVLRSAIFSYRVTWKLHTCNTHGAKK